MGNAAESAAGKFSMAAESMAGELSMAAKKTVAKLSDPGPALRGRRDEVVRLDATAQVQALPPRRPPEAQSDLLGALMARYAEGDDEVFGQLYQSLAPPLYRFCKRLTRHPAEADDVFQDSFLRLHRARATYMSGLNVLHWALAIARSAHLDRLRYWRRRPESLGSATDTAQDLRADEQDGPEAQASAHDLVQIVTAELDKMSEKNRVAYILLKEEGLSVSEAAAVLGTTTAVVKQRAHRAYEQLRMVLRAAE